MNRVSVENRIDVTRIDPDAHKVVRRLRHSGYQAYLVGGSVRDLWLGRIPKDFDIATDASPRQVKRVFGNSRLIGRRFRLAHVFFGQKIIEVSTFRSNIIAAAPDDSVGDEGEERDLLIRDDNTFGTAEEDAIRRDFTINGLFLDPDTLEVIDYINGIPDLEARVLRTIGDPLIRMQEDPVRILRAIKFAARLDFHIDETTTAAIHRYKSEILRCSPSRVHEEIMRLLAGGAAFKSIKLMWETGVLEVLLPDLTEYLQRSGGGEDDPLWKFLQSLDAVDRAKRLISPGLLIGAAFWPVLDERLSRPEYAALDYGLRIDRVVDSVSRNLRLPKRENALLKQVLIARRRLRPEEGQRRRRGNIVRMLGKGYFPATVAFCEIEMRAEGQTPEEIQAWETDLGVPVVVGEGHPRHPAGPEGAAAGETGPRKRRRRRRRRPGGADSSGAGDAGAGETKLPP